MRTVSLIFFLFGTMLYSLQVSSQICSGTINVVWKDDFGSGSVQSSPQGSPNITNGYTYQNNGVNSGNYGIENVFNYFGSWHIVPEDHTPGDTGGYFLVIDGNSSAPVFYDVVVNNICPNTRYSFSTAAMNIDLPSFPSNQTFTFIISDINGNQLSTWDSPPVAVTDAPQWNELGFSFMSGNNTSLRLQVRFNETGYDDFAFDDFQFSICGPTLSIFTNIADNSCEDSIPLFSLLGSGYASPVYQWQKRNAAGVFESIPGATEANYVDRSPSDSNFYAVIIGDGSLSCPIRATKLVTRRCLTINSYAAVLSIDFCNNTTTVDDAVKFNVGDTVVIMQMKGASIDSTNSINFGSITNLNNAGRYEFNYIKSKTGNTVEFQNTFLNKYDALRGRVQLIRVPYFSSLKVNNTLTCPEWFGVKGGVLIINSATDVTLNAPIDVSNKGFYGGAVGVGFGCGNTDLWAVACPTGGMKGEGIADYIMNSDCGGARLATGGGGAYAANSGGGGGGNYGAGGLGGSHSNTCPTLTQSMQGQAGDYSAGNRVFAGGGGGGGQQDNQQPVDDGGKGGGIVIIKALTLNSNNQKIIANGESNTVLVRDEGGGGGGAGGSVLLFVNGYAGDLAIETNGGNGNSNENTIYPTRCHGPGGGGGGGFVGSSLAVLPSFVTAASNGGKAGFVLNPASACFNTTHNATDGAPGGNIFNLTVPQATVPFKKNIDSVRINETLTACKSIDLDGIAYTNSSNIQNWEWSFGDGETDIVQNTSHTYTNYGTHTVKLVATDINGCKDSVSKIVATNGINFDFVFEQDVCNPLNVRFRAIGDTTAEIYWSKGDGRIVTDIRNPTHVYPAPGSYLVEYCTGNVSTGCIDTVRKTIYIGWRNANIILTPDTTICYGVDKLLRSNIDSISGFCWSPSGFLNNVDLANPTTSTPSTITYNLFAASEENNLVVNGDFSNGNTGFVTGYTFIDPGPALLVPGEYGINTSTLNAGVSAADCKDHMNANGNMFVAHSDAGEKTIWSQTINVSPNINYSFSMWTQSPGNASKAALQLSINGNKMPDSIIMPAASCIWKKYFTQWNSGSNTTVQLALIDRTIPNTITGFDNFAIDDIRFSPFEIKQDTVKITVDTPFINTSADTTICRYSSALLNTIGAVSYTWSPTTGLSNAAVANPVASPTDTTKYFVTGTNAFGCKATDSVIIFVKPSPLITSTGDTSICFNTPVRLFATGGTSYEWSPASLFNDPNSATPIADPATNNIRYTVAVTGANNCILKDSFIVSVKPLPVFTVSESKAVCLNTKPQLSAAGGNSYLWAPASLVSNKDISNPLAITDITTLYSVLIKDTTCGYDTTLTTTITILPLPVVTAGKENDINCAIGSSQLSAEGALQYNWLPAASLDNPAIATPVASPVNSTTYTVTGTDANGCGNTATVTVLADYRIGVSYVMPNAFSPNGDGNNDCFRPKYFGLITALQFMIYNRFGEKVFFTTNPADCWDGTYKGVPCDPGNFVYFIKAKTTCGNVERKGNIILIR